MSILSSVRKNYLEILRDNLERLEEFYSHFVDEKTKEFVQKRIAAIFKYMSANSHGQAVSGLKDLVRQRAIKSESFLVMV